MDPRHEAFAQASAKGLNCGDAYVQAGFASDRSNASKLAKRKAVAERIAELEQLRDLTPQADLAHTVAALLRSAAGADTLKSAAGTREARLSRLEAHRLWDKLAMEEMRAARPIDRVLTSEQWAALYGPSPPMSA